MDPPFFAVGIVVGNPSSRRGFLRSVGRLAGAIGDQVSPLGGWQEGALLSSEHAVLQVTGTRPTLLAELGRSPEARRMMNWVA
jgi:hypothetical protein